MRLVLCAAAALLLASSFSTSVAAPGDLTGWKWKAAQLKAAPEGSQMNKLWKQLCEHWDCMPDWLLAAIKLKKEDVVVFNCDHPSADEAWGKRSSWAPSQGVRLTLQDMTTWNVYRSKHILFEELYHSTQTQTYKFNLGTGGEPTQDERDLFFCNPGYDEIDARIKAAQFVGPMTGKVPAPPAGGLTDELAQERYDEAANAGVQEALTQMCTEYDKIKETPFAGAELAALKTFTKCKNAAKAFVAEH